MKKEEYSQILVEVAKDQIPEGLDLAPQILSRIEKGKGKNMQRRMKTLIPAAVILLGLAMVTITVPAVANTLRRWIGYVPGFGLVNDASLRRLAEPVSVTKEKVTLTVEQVTASSNKTLVKYSLKGLPDVGMPGQDLCQGEEGIQVLRLPDGNELLLLGSLRGMTDESYTFEDTFEPVPADVWQMTLVLKCVSNTNPVLLTQNWEIPLQFASAPQVEINMAPVLEVTPNLEPVSTKESASLPGLELTRIIPVEKGYILSGTLDVTPPEGLTVQEQDGFLEDMSIADANGQVVTYSPAPDDVMWELLGGAPTNTIIWACQIESAGLAWPLTLSVNSVNAITTAYPPASIQFDTGANPQGGQVWEINQDVALGPKTVHLVSIKMLDGEHGLKGYEFTFIYDPTTDVSPQIEGYSAMGGGGGGSDVTGETFTIARAFPTGMPTGLLTVILTGNGVEQIQGPWQVEVSVPVLP